MPKTNSIVLLVWRLVARGKSPCNRYPKQWHWPLDVRSTWWQGWFRQAKVVWQKYWKALGTWRREMPAKQFGTKFCLATREVCQAILGAKLDREEDFYTALDGGHYAMLCWGLSYECNSHWGNTWPLEVIAWWF